jgi:hypothetical protein
MGDVVSGEPVGQGRIDRQVRAASAWKPSTSAWTPYPQSARTTPTGARSPSPAGIETVRIDFGESVELTSAEKLDMKLKMD